MESKKILRHILTGNEGLLIKEYRPTGGVTTFQILLPDGRIFFAPYFEFITTRNQGVV